jgi:PHD/YefM family antitoxin component YafN of YafNO toxin-antitoxin module
MKTRRIAMTRCRREFKGILRKLKNNKLDELIVTKNNIEFIVILSSDTYRQLAELRINSTATHK